MDERSLTVLEYPKIIAKLKALTSFAGGAELAQNLLPAKDAATVNEALAHTAEALALLENGEADIIAGTKDVRESLARAKLGGMLTGPELLDVAETIGAIARARRVLLDDAETKPLLAARAAALGHFAETKAAIEACIGEEGRLLDRASPELARLRSNIRTWQARSRERLDAVLRSAGARNVLQENIVTRRNQRYVIPVKSEHQAAVPGIVHDVSASGATVFIEPLPVVELNNKISGARAEEQREEERILRRLTDVVGAEAAPLAASVALMAKFDLDVAKARLARNMEAIRPKLNTEGWVHIQGGRHPLLTGTVVPIDVWVGRDLRVLVITGPNTGGKTVTLKTVGLFCLMAQAGLFVPAAPGTELAVFDAVFADIGDEQSIEQSLSTFSSHMANIVRILDAMDDKSLILLDELGAGTDPSEGAALAMAILDYVAEAGATTVATTHYSELKAFVHARAGMENASVEFDLQTLAPTFRLQMGTPGRSNALAIATRLGLSDDIVQRARGRFSSAEDVQVDDMLRDLEEARREAARERGAARKFRQEAEQLHAELKDMRAQLQAHEASLREAAEAEAREIVGQARREAETIIADLRRRQHEVGVDEARAAHARLVQRQERLQRTQPATKEVPAPPPADYTPVAGDTVRVASLNQIGTVQSAPDGAGQVAVQIGSMRTVVPVASLVPVDATPAGADTAPARGRLHGSPHRTSAGGGPGRTQQRLSATKRTDVSPELHVRGQTVDETLLALEKYIDDALLAGLDTVRIIHGKGTGTLRRAVRQYLREHPLIASYNDADHGAGGVGVTVARLDG